MIAAVVGEAVAERKTSEALVGKKRGEKVGDRQETMGRLRLVVGNVGTKMHLLMSRSGDAVGGSNSRVWSASSNGYVLTVEIALGHSGGVGSGAFTRRFSDIERMDSNY